MLTAKAEETDQVVGFSMGADDYVTKPFSVKVLLQRIKALQRLRQGVGDPVDLVEHLGVQIDRVRHRTFVNGRELDLTPTEFRLLECLLRQPGRAFTRHQLMDAAIGEGAIVLERTIDVHIKTLRRKLGDMDLIETVRGVGYRFRESLDSHLTRRFLDAGSSLPSRHRGGRASGPGLGPPDLGPQCSGLSRLVCASVVELTIDRTP